MAPQVSTLTITLEGDCGCHLYLMSSIRALRPVNVSDVPKAAQRKTGSWSHSRPSSQLLGDSASLRTAGVRKPRTTFF